MRQGTRRDTVLFSVGANNHHGLRRTNNDKQIAVETLLRDHEWGLWSDNAIAKACGVSQPFVSKIRASICPSSNDYKMKQRTAQRQGKTYTIKTANIGNSSQLSSSHYSCNEDTPSEDITTSTTIEELSDEVEHNALHNVVQTLDREQDEPELLEGAEDGSKYIVSEPILHSQEEEELLLEVEQSDSSSSVEPELFAQCDRTDASNVVEEITAVLARAEFPSALEIITLLNTFEQNLGAETFGRLVVEAVPLDHLVNLCNKCLIVLSEQEKPTSQV